jgi:Secretion system C-terminal sorting domain
LYFRTSDPQPQQLSVYDVNGSLVLNQAYKTEIDISTLSTGIYFVEVVSSNGVARKRFIKM